MRMDDSWEMACGRADLRQVEDEDEDDCDGIVAYTSNCPADESVGG